MNDQILLEINNIIHIIAKVIEVCGVLTIIVGGIASTVNFFQCRLAKVESSYQNFRSSLGRAVLLGLEFLVAGDIIGTVAVEPTFKSLGVLGLIVIIRTFLSFSLEVEINGRWPWQKAQSAPLTK
jgi:uncharacterized membrane protein